MSQFQRISDHAAGCSRALRAIASGAVCSAILLQLAPRAVALDIAQSAGPATGTHIRGTADTAFPIWVYNRDVIEASGANTLEQFIQLIPQNFNGGASENTISSVTGGGNAANEVNGTGVNLRGLGNDATLVLVNGHRIAPGNGQGNFVDISLIPLYAVERIEVVTDGASAIYGSDAVGGVVNIILGRNLDGADTRARYSAVTDGSSRDREIGQTVGHGWDTGSALVIYDYSDRTPLSASSRSYSSSAATPFMLLPSQLRHSAFASLDQTLTPQIELFADGIYSHRSTYNDRTVFATVLRDPSVIDTYDVSAGLRFELPRGSQLELSAAYSASDTRTASLAAGSADPVSNNKVKSDVLSVDGRLDGILYPLPAGNVRFAIGAQFRQERFSNTDLVAGTEFRPGRHITAGFGELRVPLLGPRPEVAGAANLLELTLADRIEHYNDFGSSNNPQLGLIWNPLTMLKFRATYGTSFRAPLLNDLNPVPFQVVPAPEADPSTGGLTNALLVFGGNPDLRPEKARTWTTGLDFTPSSLNLRLSATYYDTKFTDVVADPEFSVDITDALNQAELLGPTIVQRNPSAARVRQFADSPGFENFFGIDLATIGAIVDSRVHNLSIVRTRGVDVQGSWASWTPLGNLELGLNTTYIFRFDSQFTSSAPVVSVLNTQYNPVNLRARARAMLRRGGFAFASFINYTNSYAGNDASGVNGNQDTQRIASWTTVDMSAKYFFSADTGPLEGASVLLAVTNLMNRNPPFAANPLFAINFDGANANALGRVYSLQLAKRW